MVIRDTSNGFVHPLASEITAPGVYRQRRRFLAHMASGAAGLSLAAWAQRDARASLHRPGKLAPIEAQASSVSGAMVMDKVTPYTDASTYNNFYEFGTDKSDPARNAHTLVTSPWQIQIDGLVKKPGPLDLAELLKLSPMEERIYRMRCVEGWSMVIPWVGYSLSALIRRVEPLGSAKFVQFETLADRKTMPYVGSRVLDWPYVEGLRLDEAMHPLTLLTFGMYGEVLPKQNGAPVRLEEVATVRDSVEDSRVAGWFNGTRGMILAVLRQPGSNTVATVEAIRAVLPACQAQLPPAVLGFQAEPSP